MRWLVTGAQGMLGRDLVTRLTHGDTGDTGHPGHPGHPGHSVRALGRSGLDITDPAAVAAAVEGADVVVNCAAWTDVDGAEAQESAAARVNAEGPRNLARASRAAGARLVHLSTDYVFAGDADRPYEADDELAPLSAYGRTKAEGERAVRAEHPEGHLVVRTAWLYGAGGRCFPRTMAGLAKGRDRLQVVDDQHGQPTWTVDVADLVLRLVEGGVPAGTYHATASGRTTWFGFAREVVAAAGVDPAVVHPTTTAEFPRPAPRPAYSVLGHRSLQDAGVEPIGRWDDRWRVAAPVVLAPYVEG